MTVLAGVVSRTPSPPLNGLPASELPESARARPAIPPTAPRGAPTRPATTSTLQSRECRRPLPGTGVAATGVAATGVDGADVLAVASCLLLHTTLMSPLHLQP